MSVTQVNTDVVLDSEEEYDFNASSKAAKATAGLGFMLKVFYNKTYQTTLPGPGTVNEWPEGSEPPISDPNPLIEHFTITVHHSRRCIRCTHGGKVVEICR